MGFFLGRKEILESEKGTEKGTRKCWVTDTEALGRDSIEKHRQISTVAEKIRFYFSVHSPAIVGFKESRRKREGDEESPEDCLWCGRPLTGPKRVMWIYSFGA